MNASRFRHYFLRKWDEFGRITQFPSSTHREIAPVLAEFPTQLTYTCLAYPEPSGCLLSSFTEHQTFGDAAIAVRK